MTRRSSRPTFITPTLAAGLLLLAGAYLMGQRVTALSGRLGKVEQEAEYSHRDRENRSTRRDLWLTKVTPAAAAIGAIFVALAIPLGWLK